MALDGADGDAELLGDLTVRQVASDQLENLGLATRQAVHDSDCASNVGVTPRKDP